jgi:hypothetical protein
MPLRLRSESPVTLISSARSARHSSTHPLQCTLRSTSSGVVVRSQPVAPWLATGGGHEARCRHSLR